MRSRSPHMGWKEASRGMTTRPIGCFHSGRRGNALHHSGVRLYRPRGETVIAGRIFDPERFRGWSGSDNVGFTISVTDATPSYLPGPLPAGGWHLNAGSTEYPDPRHSRYTAKISDCGGARRLPSSFRNYPRRVVSIEVEKRQGIDLYRGPPN